MFWLGAGGPLAFAAFLVTGGIFAVSIPSNTVIGLRLERDCRASAMGIAVGLLMGSQALGAALGGLSASVVGESETMAGALGLATIYGLWALITTPSDAKHLVRRRPKAAAPSRVIDLSALDEVAVAAPGPSVMVSTR